MESFLKTQLIMSLVCEDFDLDEEAMMIDQALLENYEAPINFISRMDSEDRKNAEKSDEKSEDILSMLDIDSLADRLEAEEDEEKTNLKVNVVDNKKHFNLRVEEDDDSIDSAEEIGLLVKKNSWDDINLNLSDSRKNGDIRVNLKNDEKINISVKDNKVPRIPVSVSVEDPDQKTINVNVNDSKKSGDISVKLKTGKKETGDFNVRIVNNKMEPEDKMSSFIKKRDELISSNDANLQFSTCLKIVTNLKTSLDRLVNYIPDEKILAQTKYLVGDMLDNLMDNSTLIMRDPKRIKKIIYKIFDCVMSINRYIEKMYARLEDKLDMDTKNKENTDISKQIQDTEVNDALRPSIEREKNNSYGENLRGTPLINRKKI